MESQNAKLKDMKSVISSSKLYKNENNTEI